jgi:hypothetical protein
MKKGSHHKKESKQKIKLARKKQGSNVWNKGLKGYGKYKGEKPYKILRQNRNYYLEELKNNAIRSVKNGYNNTDKRRKEINNKTVERQIRTGFNRPKRDWNNKEIQFLKENYRNMLAEKIALELNRSWSSIVHKAVRLKLLKYNKWTK